MSKTELIQKLRKIDEVTLLELLDVSSDELVDAFLEKVDDRIQYLYQQLEHYDTF